MTGAKVWILALAVLILTELRLVFSVPTEIEKMFFFLVAASVLTNITACYTAG